MGFISRLLRIVLTSGCLLFCSILLIISGFTLYLGPKLPHIDSIRDMKLQTPLRIYSADGKLMGEFGETRRQPLAYTEIPPLFVQAILAAEDDRFFHHAGVDINGLARAASELAKSGHIRSGGSTITMQLARNFFLSTEKSFTRKFNEILLSLQMERSLSKEEIFELYANKIFLGNRAYGVQAAAFVYYGKSLQELSLEQWAMLAGLPKAPSSFNPLVNPDRAMLRRNWILDRMLKLGFIDKQAHDIAIAAPETASYHGLQTDFDAPFTAEMARQFATDKLGAAAYSEGYNVYTTIDSRLQTTAQQAVWHGVVSYDHRHGYRGAEGHVEPPSDTSNAGNWQKLIANAGKVGDLEAAVVTKCSKSLLQAVLRDGTPFNVTLSESQARILRPYKTEDYLGVVPTDFNSIFKSGDIIRVRKQSNTLWEIDQIPKVQASLIAINSNNGAIEALVGGSDYNWNKFNRATQAMRQPGSNFKPFMYLKALEEGYTAATLINDSPLVFQEAGMEQPWRPENSGDEYLGPTRLRKALYESRNMVSIRILQNLGVQETIKSLPRFGFNTQGMQPNLSLALGSHAMTPMTVANAYAVLANGGYKVDAFYVSRIEDSSGHIIYQQNPPTVCKECEGESGSELQIAPRVVDEQTAFMIDDILKDVIRKGTGRPALELNRPDIAGKTGTTNGPTDAWFSGYNPAIVATTWLGFDDNTPLGKKEYGGTAALPMWIDFMREALRDSPVIERDMPQGLVTVRIDPETGLRAPADRSDAIFEIFRTEQAPAEITVDSTAPANDTEQTPASHAQTPTAADDIF